MLKEIEEGTIQTFHKQDRVDIDDRNFERRSPFLHACFRCTGVLGVSHLAGHLDESLSDRGVVW